jgi:hypothetical protein
MRNLVTFEYPAPYVGASKSEDILGVEGVAWFIEILRRIPSLEIEGDLVQEDWGVVAITRHAKKTFWIGLSAEREGEWIAHVHHPDFAWVQRVTRSGKRARYELVRALEAALHDAGATSMTWFEERDINLRGPGTPSCAD